jgi:acetyl-CoA carboxylase alpha subunit
VAPDLVEIHKKYKDRNVVFIGLTQADRAAAESFVRELGVTWPNGYGAAETISNLMQGVGAPTFFVVGADGYVFWNDDRARFRHDTDSLCKQLDRVIEAALIQADGI